LTHHATVAVDGGSRVAISFKGAHFPSDIMLMGVRWYLACPSPRACRRRWPSTAVRLNFWPLIISH